MKPYILALPIVAFGILIIASCGMLNTSEIGLGQALMQIAVSTVTIGYCAKGMKNAPVGRQSRQAQGKLNHLNNTTIGGNVNDLLS